MDHKAAIHSPMLFSALSLIQSNMYYQKTKCFPEILLDIAMCNLYMLYIYIYIYILVCNFQSMKSPVELNSLLKSFFMTPTISFIIFSDFLMFYQIFLSLQVERCAIVSYKHGIYEFPHALLNNLRLKILGN